MLPSLVSVALQHDRFHVVVEYFARYVAKEAERIAVALFQRVVAHIIGELDVQHSAEPQNSNEHMKGGFTVTHGAPVNLHLPSGLCF